MPRPEIEPETLAEIERVKDLFTSELIRMILHDLLSIGQAVIYQYRKNGIITKLETLDPTTIELDLTIPAYKQRIMGIVTRILETEEIMIIKWIH